MITLWSVGPLARLSVLEPIVRAYMRLLGKLVFWSFEARPVETPSEMIDEWNRMMPTAGNKFPVLDADETTAHGAIRVHCPLRGTGDARACYRLMEFDRAIVAGLGGELVVVDSQSVAGDECRVRIRRAGAAANDPT